MKLPDLGKMIGPLPLGAWVAVTVGGVGLALVGNRGTDRGQTDGSKTTPTSASPTPIPVGSTMAGSGAVPLSGGGSVSETIGASGKPTTNDEWLNVTAQAVVAGGAGAYATLQALTAYLEGRQLTHAQAALVESALRYSGPPPTPPILAPDPLPAPGQTSGNTPANPAPDPTPPPPIPPPPVMPTPTVPPPAPPAGIPPLPDTVRERLAPGEVIVDQLAAPGGGGWYLSSYGGVFAVEAPFYGAPRNENFGPPTPRRATRIVPLGRGYRVLSNFGEFYDYGA